MIHSCDILIIGSGIAGLSFALHAAKFGRVVMITKKRSEESNSNYAQGGIACVVADDDTFERHIADTCTAGADLCNIEAVRTMVEEGPDRIADMVRWGIHFSTDTKTNNPYHFHLGKEGGHSRNRIIHSHDLTGRAVENALLTKAKNTPSITIYENAMAVELITNHHITRPPKALTCFGAYLFNPDTGTVETIRASVTCLATGGMGQVYQYTTNPAIATGDGIAMAYRAGAEIANMEFIQFHPTSLYHAQGNSFLISEALRGYGARLCNRDGEYFMHRYHPQKSLAPRDIVARAIDSEMKRSGSPCVYLDVRHKPAKLTRKHFPNIYKRCKELGIDITRDLIPVVPAAHYLCGGIMVDLHGRSSIRNLYAIGETSCTGVHGANRLASNSLLEALVFARRAADDIAGRLPRQKRIGSNRIPPWDDSTTTSTEEWILLLHNLQEIKNVMWDYVGIVRSTIRLKRAQRRITLLEGEIEDFYKRTRITAPLLELRNLVTTAKLIIVAARKRRESRGLHYTTDYPRTDNHHWKRDTTLIKPV